MAVFGSFLNDFVIAFFLGVLGGVAAELIANNGSIEFPHLPSDTLNLFDMGLFSNILIGGVAALAYFFILEPTTDQYKFVGVMIGAGVGGTAVLTAIKEKIVSTNIQGNAEVQTMLMNNAADNVEGIINQLNELQTKLDTPQARTLTGFKDNIELLRSSMAFTGSSLRKSALTSEENLKKIKKIRHKEEKNT